MEESSLKKMASFEREERDGSQMAQFQIKDGFDNLIQ